MLLSKALAQPNQPNIIFTFVWAFGDAEDHAFIAKLVTLFEAKGQTVFLVELLASVQARIQREGTPLRLALKPAKRDVARARALHLELEGRYQLSSLGQFPYPAQHFMVNTESQSPMESARLIAERFGFTDASL